MVLKEKDIKEIKKQFYAMRTKEQFLLLLNVVKRLYYGEKNHPFVLKQLNYHYHPKANKKRYIEFVIKKKSGKERVICAPNIGLKEIQKCLNIVLQVVYQPNQAANGFVQGKSILDNAKVHAGNIFVYNIDLKDFFPSIDQARVWSRLKYPPFNLNKEKNREELANIIASLCCHEFKVERKDETGNFVSLNKSVLPQGAPTSPTLSNIICERLDHRLSGVAKRFGLKYSRYADDITFSSMHDVFKKDGAFISEIKRIVSDQNFIIQDTKTRLQRSGYRQEVTGLTVNEKPNVNRRYLSEIRMWLYYWEHYGYVRAESYFIPKYKANKGHVKKGQPSLANVLSGKLEFLKMIRGAESISYQKLASTFERLNERENPLQKVIESWENEGIEKAISTYLSFKENANG